MARRVERGGRGRGALGEGAPEQQEGEGDGDRRNIRIQRPASEQAAPVKVLYTNAQSILGKINELIAQVFILEPDIILLTETWLN